MIKLLSFLVVVLMSAALSASAQESLLEQAQQHQAKGKRYSLEGDFEKANEEFKKAETLLNSAPKQIATMSSQEKPLKQRETVLMTLIKKAQKAAVENQTEQAIEGYLKALHIAPDNANIRYNLSIQYLKRRDYWNAAQELLQVLRLNPDDPDAHYNLGVLYEIYLNKNKRAADHYLQYLNLRPNAPDRNIVQTWIDTLKEKER